MVNSMQARIPEKEKQKMIDDPFYSTCAFSNEHECAGRITWEHALYYKNKRINKKGAIIPCCAKAHGVDQYQDSKEEIPKKKREWVALNLIDIEEYKKEFPRYDWEQRKKYLNSLFGEYKINKRNMKIALGIPVLNQEEITRNFFNHLNVNTGYIDEIIIVDNGSDIPFNLIDYNINTDIIGDLKIIRNEENIGVRGALNQILDAAESEIICYTHNDVELTHHGWDTELHAAFVHLPTAGIIGCYGAKGIGVDNIYQIPYELTQLGRRLNVSDARMDQSVHGFRNLQRPYENVAVFDGFFMAIRKELLNKTGGFSDILPQHHNYDNLISIQSLENGYENFVIPLRFNHIGGQTDVNENWNKNFGKEKSEVHADAHPPLYEYGRGLLPVLIYDIFDEDDNIIGYQLYMDRRKIKEIIYE